MGKDISAALGLNMGNFSQGMSTADIQAELMRQLSSQKQGPGVNDPFFAAFQKGGSPSALMADFYGVPFYTRDAAYGGQQKGAGVMVQPGTPWAGPGYGGVPGVPGSGGGSSGGGSGNLGDLGGIGGGSGSGSGSNGYAATSGALRLPQWYIDWYNQTGLKGGKPVAGLLG